MGPRYHYSKVEAPPARPRRRPPAKLPPLRRILAQIRTDAEQGDHRWVLAATYPNAEGAGQAGRRLHKRELEHGHADDWEWESRALTVDGQPCSQLYLRSTLGET